MTVTTEYSARNATEALDLVLQLHWVRPSSLNPRKHFDEAKLADLAESIRQHGLMEPIVVRETREATPAFPMATFEIVAGERRYRACLLAGLTEVPVRNLGAIDDRMALELALIENLQRVDLDPIEEAEGYRQLNRVVGKTQVEIATAVNRSQPAVANAMRLLELPEDVQGLIRGGDLSVSHGVGLAKWKAYPEFVSRIGGVAAERHWTAKEIERIDPSDWQASSAKAARELYPEQRGTPFVKTICLSCPFGAYLERKQGERYAQHYCLKPSHYAELVAAHEAEQDALARAALAALPEDAAALPNLSDLKYNTYRECMGKVPAGCSADCPCRAKALNYGKTPVPICTDPKRFDGLQRQQAAAEKKAKRQERASREVAASTAVDGLQSAEKHALVVLVEGIVSSLGYSKQGVLKAAIARLGLALDAEKLTSYEHGREGKRIRALAQLSEAQLVRLGVEVRLQGDLADQYGENTYGGQVVNWYLKRIVQGEASADERGGEVAATAVADDVTATA